jgi:hypothetical protein
VSHCLQFAKITIRQCKHGCKKEERKKEKKEKGKDDKNANYKGLDIIDMIFCI